MPDMERLTWEGIALHVGDLPGYPALQDPGPILGVTAEGGDQGETREKRACAEQPRCSHIIVVSRADQRIYVLENGDLVGVGDAVITSPGEPLRPQHICLEWRRGEWPGGVQLGRQGFHASPDAAVALNTTVLQRTNGSPQIMTNDQAKIKPGTVLVTTDLPAAAESRSSRDFTVIDGPAS